MFRAFDESPARHFGFKYSAQASCIQCVCKAGKERAKKKE